MWFNYFIAVLLTRIISVLSLFLRNLFFTILQPGIVAGLAPYWILRGDIDVKQSWQFYHYAGASIFIIGLIIMLHCIINFAIKGRGTLSPADPTKRLVISGLYKYSRNPMYVGVMLILVSESIFFKAQSLWMYSLFVFIAFNLFIIFFEEQRLRKDFGNEYEAYCKKVRRWM